jgi:hypothetical protein
MGPTRVSGYVDMKLSQAFMEPGLNNIPTTHVMKKIIFMKRKGIQQLNLNFSEFQQ